MKISWYSRCKAIFILGVCLLGVLYAGGQQRLGDLQFDPLVMSKGGASNEVRQIYQDREGFIWLATNSGLLRYDGYEFVAYKSNLHARDLLSNNTIQALAEDYTHNLWIGTARGLDVLHKPTGKITKIALEKLKSGFIQSLLVARNNDVWIGTSRGLVVYRSVQDTFLAVGPENFRGGMQGGDIKSLFEDSRGQIWVGTWADGLWRYNPADSAFYVYPSLNPANSAHVIYEDSQENIWVGTWGYGLKRLVDPYDPDAVKYVSYSHVEESTGSLLDNIIYAIGEDINTHTLWVGSRKGLSLLKDPADPYSFVNYMPGDKEHPLAYNEVNSILRGKDNVMWLGLFGGGVYRVDSHKQQFNLHQLEEIKSKFSTTSVRSLLQDEEGNTWIGIGNFGLACYKREENRLYHYTELSDFRSFPDIPTVNTILQSARTKEIWFGSYDGGIYIYDKQAPPGKRIRQIDQGNTSWLLNTCIYHLFEDSRLNIWIATRGGVNMITPDGRTFSFADLHTAEGVFRNPSIMAVGEDADGSIWFGSNQYGIFRMKGDPCRQEEINFEHYALTNRKLFSDNVYCFYTDSRKNFWAGTEGEGLVVYDKSGDCFQTMHEEYSLPGDAVFSIVEDDQGYLWLGTNEGLISLTIANDNIQGNRFRLYTTIDGLQDNSFNRNAVCKGQNGELFFGGHKGYNSFYPALLQENKYVPSVAITDIKIFNRSWKKLDEKNKQEISSLAPEFTSKIVLSHRNNNFSIHFAVLSYASPEQNKYAYRLEGFDQKWKFADASQRFAYYNNLKSGEYRFLVKGANEHGVWSKQSKVIEVVVKPAPWNTWWAYCIYISVIAGIIYYIFKLMHKRLEMEAAVKLAKLKQQKSEEINHAKLQFFTNITHELMTPLTIISASLDELKLVLPAHSDYYEVLSGNTRRLMRLIQQILEFRKAESGNLKLRVSRENLTHFIKNSVDSFRPLIKRKGIVFSLLMPEKEVKGYFDRDKLDKILYNLLSNAAKYNKEKGLVEIQLEYEEATGKATIAVKDNGEGISEEAMNNLFQRFYEGNYRRFNTVGTGIGLSLTKDLVELHRGKIRVESEKGKGATFTVELSLLRDTYDEEQIDEENPGLDAEDTPEILPEELHGPETENETKTEKEDPEEAPRHYTLLLVEDNEELLQLMSRLLNREYRVLSAHNGQEAVGIVEREQVDLIVSDVMMPVMDGIELCKYMKGKLELCHIPFIMLTAKQSDEDKIAGYDSGADGYLTKPFSLSVLHARIQSLLRNRERTARDFKKQMVLETKELNYTSLDEAFMQKAVDCIYQHLDDSEFDVEQFTKVMGTSKSALYAKLKSLTGLHTSAFIRNIRLKAACQIIEEKKKVRISELAYAVGFNDAKYFSVCFKKEFGMLPTEYMEKYK